MSLIWFIRHGESISNANLPTTHPALTELTPRGWDEAEQIAAAFDTAPDLIVTSSFTRTRETAVPTIQRFPHVRQETWPVHEFTYLHPQRYFNTRGSERGQWAMPYWQRSDPLEKEGEIGESFAELLARLQQVQALAVRRPEDWIVVFTHGLFTRCLLWQMITGITVPTKEAMGRYGRFTQAVSMPNGAILPIAFEPESPPRFSGFLTSHMTRP